MTTLFSKLWRAHVVHEEAEGPALLYVDRHLVCEVTSPQAFDGLHSAGRPVRRVDTVLATVDHNVPTVDRDLPFRDPLAAQQVDTLRSNCRSAGITLFDMHDARQGIVHVMGPEQGATLPGMTVVCGDSHTSTHGAFGALAWGIGTSEIEHALATQCVWIQRPQTMRIRCDGRLTAGVTAKDLALAVIGILGSAGATGYAIEFCGEAVRALGMAGRMTLCNMAVEAGARFGLIAVDDETLRYLNGRPYAPTGAQWHEAALKWRALRSDPDAVFDRELVVAAGDVRPLVTWGTSPDMAATVDGVVPDPARIADPVRRASIEKALAYMGLEPGMPIASIGLDKIFIGSCTNSRIEDLRAAAAIVRGQRVASRIKQALVVPGSGLVKAQAEREGLHDIFIQAGFEWREPGCSMCLGMNDDRLEPGERCASTSNRNFEGRQGRGGRSHLVSPAMAAAAAITGHFVDIS